MIAVDTNVLIYACDQADSRCQKIALDLIAASSDGVLLWQRVSVGLSQAQQSRIHCGSRLEPPR
jgi:predicted nucleic acid-binding protein